MGKIEVLKKKCAEIDNEVKKLYSFNTENEINPIFDGIINAELYLKSKIKILWILKEPYDEFDENNNPYGGGWDFKDTLNCKQSKKDFGKGINTFKNMIYVSWGILNDFCSWQDIPDIDEKPQIINSFKSTGFINIKKLPGYKKSPPNVIAKAYRDFKGILHRQINEYSPDVIIFCGTLSKDFRNDLQINLETVEEAGEFSSYFIKNKKLFISTCHPSTPILKKEENEEEYCDGIINAVKSWTKQK
jgi:hypothetical protein